MLASYTEMKLRSLRKQSSSHGVHQRPNSHSAFLWLTNYVWKDQGKQQRYNLRCHYQRSIWIWTRAILIILRITLSGFQRFLPFPFGLNANLHLRMCLHSGAPQTWVRPHHAHSEEGIHSHLSQVLLPGLPNDAPPHSPPAQREVWPLSLDPGIQSPSPWKVLPHNNVFVYLVILGCQTV